MSHFLEEGNPSIVSTRSHLLQHDSSFSQRLYIQQRQYQNRLLDESAYNIDRAKSRLQKRINSISSATSNERPPPLPKSPSKSELIAYAMRLRNQGNGAKTAATNVSKKLRRQFAYYGEEGNGGSYINMLQRQLNQERQKGFVPRLLKGNKLEKIRMIYGSGSQPDLECGKSSNSLQKDSSG